MSAPSPLRLVPDQLFVQLVRTRLATLARFWLWLSFWCLNQTTFNTCFNHIWLWCRCRIRRHLCLFDRLWLRRCLLFLAGKTLFALTITFNLTLAVLAFLLLAAHFHLTGSFTQHTHIMLSMLLEGFRCNAVIRQLCVASKLIVLVDDLLRRTAHLALWTRAIKHTVHDIAATCVVAIGTVAVVLRTRTRSLRFHVFKSAFVIDV